MKIKIEKKFVQIGLTIFFTAIAILLVVFFIWDNDSIKHAISKFNTVLAPVYIGFIIAYLLSPILNWYERKILYPLFDKRGWQKNNPKKKDNIRIISVTLTILSAILFLYLFFWAVIPELIKSIQNIVNNYSVYTQNLVNWVNDVIKNNKEIAEITAQFVVDFSSETDNWLNDFLLPTVTKLLPDIKDVLAGFSSGVIGFFTFLWNFFVGLVISIYVLASKEKFKQNCTKMLYAFLEKKSANKFIESARFTHQTFIGFLSGKILDSAIIGVICFICLSIMKMPYSILISFVVGVTNIIPFFGPLFGAIPCTIIVLMVDPKMALYFVIFILILQQFDGNILGPKILSSTTGITTFWVICSITVFSGFWGVLGMIIAVPITAVIFTFINSITDGKLIKKNLPKEPEKYLNVGEITEDNEFIDYVYEKQKKPPKDTKFNRFVKKIFVAIKDFFVKIINSIKNKMKKN